MTATRLGSFIQDNMGAILREWELFARTRIPAAATMSVPELRDHAEEILRAIAEDISRPETEAERSNKSKGLADATDTHPTAASAHGAIRHLSGFDLIQVVSEFRALRASILRLWALQAGGLSHEDVEDLTRFSESIDQVVAESVASYSAKIDESRDIFLAVLGHDLRGPLASLSNCVQLQSGAEQAPDLRDRVLHIARRSIASMDEMITDLSNTRGCAWVVAWRFRPDQETSGCCARKSWNKPVQRIRECPLSTRAMRNSQQFSTARASIMCSSICWTTPCSTAMQLRRSG
jgi:signal transduction histidine kinase